jgi:hypothetical protein
VVELIGTPLLHASRGYMCEKAGVSLEQGKSWRSSVHDLQTDLALALVHFDQMTKGELRHSREAVMRITAISFTNDCLARELRLPKECEIRDHLVSKGFEYSGHTQRTIERQWNRLFQWWRRVFLPDEQPGEQVFKRMGQQLKYFLSPYCPCRSLGASVPACRNATLTIPTSTTMLF